MNRYAIIAKGRPLADIERIAKEYGGSDMTYAPAVGQLFCTLDPSAAARLNNVDGLTVKQLKRVSTKYTDALQVSVPEKQITLPRQGLATPLDTYSALVSSTAPYWYEVASSFDPPITGAGGTCAILDSGVRKTHRGLLGKVIYEKNFSNSPTLEDIYNHGTAVAYALCGGQFAEHQDQGIAPGVLVVSIKVLDDDGEGDEENVVLGLNEVIRLIDEAYDAGHVSLDPEVITSVNLSFGEPDDGDPDNPLRVACRAVRGAHEEKYGWKMPVVAAAGNGGPVPGSIVCPACDPEVWAVGAANISPYGVSSYSSRGPTLEGHVKPDIVFYGTNITLASSADDDSYVVKSGTSFAVPFAVGAGFNLWEILRRVDPEGAESLTTEELLHWISQVSVKPEGLPVDKDNDYGYGLPSGGVLAQMMTGAAVPGLITSGIISMVVPIMGLAMVGMMMSGMTKGMRG